MGHTKNLKGHFCEKNIVVPLLTLHWPHPIAKKAGEKKLAYALREKKSNFDEISFWHIFNFSIEAHNNPMCRQNICIYFIDEDMEAQRKDYITSLRCHNLLMSKLGFETRS